MATKIYPQPARCLFTDSAEERGKPLKWFLTIHKVIKTVAQSCPITIVWPVGKLLVWQGNEKFNQKTYNFSTFKCFHNLVSDLPTQTYFSHCLI